MHIVTLVLLHIVTLVTLVVSIYGENMEILTHVDAKFNTKKYTLKYHILVSELSYLNQNKIGNSSNFEICIL